MENEDKLKQMVEGVESLHFVLAIAGERNAIVPNVHALLDRTLADIDALCGLQLAPREDAPPSTPFPPSVLDLVLMEDWPGASELAKDALGLPDTVRVFIVPESAVVTIEGVVVS